MLRKEHEIIYEFVKTPWKKFTFREIKDISGKTSDSYVYGCLKGHAKQGLLLKENAGNVILYSLNLTSIKAQCYAGFISEFIAWKKRNIPIDVINPIAAKIPTSFYSLIITGSYANNTQKKNSDIDMVIICDNSLEPKQIYAELAHYAELSIPPIHLYVFKKQDFLLMLTSKKANYGKEIANNCLVFAGGKEYYSILAEAMQNGFVG